MLHYLGNKTFVFTDRSFYCNTWSFHQWK